MDFSASLGQSTQKIPALARTYLRISLSMSQCWETTWRTGVKGGKALVFPDYIPTAPAREEAIGDSLHMHIMVWFCVLQDSFVFVLRCKWMFTWGGEEQEKSNIQECFAFFRRWSVSCDHKRVPRRETGNPRFIITHRVLKTQSGHAMRYPHSRVHQGRGAQPSSYESRERVRPCMTNQGLYGSRGGAHQQKTGGNSIAVYDCHQFTVRGPCGSDQNYHKGAPGHLGRVLTVCLRGYGSSRNIRSFNIYSTRGQLFNQHFGSSCKRSRHILH